MTAKKKARACARPGRITSKKRRELPARAFALPQVRKYPLYTIAGGRLVPNATHARNAKGRALTEHKRGKLSMAQYLRIVAKADRVLVACSKKKKKARKRTNPGSSRSENARLNGALRLVDKP